MTDLIPSLPGFRPLLALALAVSALLIIGAGRLAALPLPHLGARGLFPGALRLLRGMAPLFGILTLVLAALHLLPLRWAPLALVAMLGGALAMGWSLRDPVRDMLAGWLLRADGTLLPGRRVHLGDMAGLVEKAGWRATSFRTRAGGLIIIPNHVLSQGPLRIPPHGGEPAHVSLDLHGDIPPEEIRRTLRELALLLPQVAPRAAVEVARGAGGGWKVSTLVLDESHVEPFSTALRELVAEVAVHAPPDPS